MSDLTKLLVKLAKEGIIVDLAPYATVSATNINAIRIELHLHDKAITSAVTITTIELMDIDMLEYMINELYEKLIHEVNIQEDEDE